jgi:hypothetical protein
MSIKRTVSQSVFDNPSLRRVISAATKDAVSELNSTPRHLLDPGNPNHPSYDLHIFGRPADEFMAMQRRPKATQP